jgi:hypothetical protein
MKLYLLTQNKVTGYGTYDSAIVAARNRKEAQNTEIGDTGEYGSWARPEDVEVRYLGMARVGTKAGVIASFNSAG